MRKNKLPEFTLLLEQFFTEYMPFSSGLSPNTIRSYKHSFRLLFQYIYQVQKKNADEILFRDLDYETIDGFLKWIETERGCSPQGISGFRRSLLFLSTHKTEILKLQLYLPMPLGGLPLKRKLSNQELPFPLMKSQSCFTFPIPKNVWDSGIRCF